jgi:hypothetical protein
MEKYRIEFINTEEINSDIRCLIEDYWKRVNEELKFTNREFAEEYSCKENEITKIIQNYSCCLVREQCSNCKEEYERKVKSKAYFSGNIGTYAKFCPKCIEDIQRREQEKEQERKREREEIEKKKRIEAEEKDRQKFEEEEANVIDKLHRLNEYELDVFIKIVADNNPNSIKRNVFNDDKDDKCIWRILYMLREFELIDFDNINIFVIGVDINKNMTRHLNKFLQEYRGKSFKSIADYMERLKAVNKGNEYLVFIPQKILDQISQLAQTVLSQQQTIDYLCKSTANDKTISA